MQAKFASKYLSQDVNQVPLNEPLSVARADLKELRGTDRIKLVSPARVE
jgi:hypothetical protein